MSGELRDMVGHAESTEPVVVVTAPNGKQVAVPRDTAEGIRWSLRKWTLMREYGVSGDFAEAIVQTEMANEDAGD